ncbi:LLM class flavin-dependent oxidoreductase [Caenispirillum bisanense]|uniref:Luciferase-like monooxygenase n=1 Tax=Caenispirillum bisanense TaxID=414052 RepID=A0A286G3M8_9PROT|nr:LLM class flavin-dependent oxidoreductase [Caenispirillum bisanense]SOD90150.1 luciferase family oxidoreductase, group 1 [Caenispirillum bisanense]
MSVPLSVLDLAPIVRGGDAAQAFRNALDLARHAEALGYRRFWLAEHHAMPGVASAATAVLIGHIAGGTSTIRVGSGGVMLPNHAPLVIAEQFGTLESLYPGRIDLGLGRAPGTDQRTAAALRRDMGDTGNRFPQDVQELQAYFEPGEPGGFGRTVRAVPGEGLRVPIWLLGSSLFSAQLAAMLGLPFAFASHFAPGAMMDAVRLYRSEFRPSRQLAQPHVMLGLNVFAADGDDDARRLFTSLQQQFLALRRGRPDQVPPPVDDIASVCAPEERAGIDHALRRSVVGGPETVRRGLAAFVEEAAPDEIMVTAQIFDHAARLRSFTIAAEAMASL